MIIIIAATPPATDVDRLSFDMKAAIKTDFSESTSGAASD